MQVQKDSPISSAWYFVAILGAFLGGVICYVVIRNENRRIANRLLWVGIASTFIVWPAVFVAGNLYINNSLLPHSQNIQTNSSTVQRTQATRLSNGTIAGPAAPVGVAVDSSGTVYWANYDSGQLLAMPKAASTASILLSGLNHPSGVAVDSSGNVYYSEYLGQTVSELQKGSTTPTLLFNARNYVPFISVDSKGNIFFVSGQTCNGNAPNSIMEYVRSSGQSVTILQGTGSKPSFGDVFAAASGDLYYTDCGNGTVDRLPAGSTTPQVLVSGLNWPNGIAVDSHGNVYYTEYSVGVFVLKVGSSSSVEVGAYGHTHYGLALDNQGNVFYTDNLGGTIWEIPAS